MKISPAQINNFLQNPCAYKAVLLYGPDQGKASLISQKILNVVKNIYGKLVSVREIDYGLVKQGKVFLHDMLASIDIFANYTVFKIVNVEETLDKNIVQLLKDFNCKNNYIIFLAKDLKNKSAIRILFDKDSTMASIGCYVDISISKILDYYINYYNLQLTRSAWLLLQQKLKNSKRMTIVSQIEKLKYYSLGKKNITEEDVALCIDFFENLSLDDLCAMIFDGNISDFCDFVNVEKINVIGMIYCVRNYLNLIYSIHLLNDKTNNLNEAINLYKPPIFFAKVFSLKSHVKKIKQSDVARLLNKLFDVEEECKLYHGSTVLIFVNFVIYLQRFLRNNV